MYEVTGHPGMGKTQLCLTASAECLIAGGNVIYIDTKGDFSQNRLRQILQARGVTAASLESDLLQRILLCKIGTEAELVKAVNMVAEMKTEKLQLLVIDNITVPLLRLITDDQIQRGMYVGCSLSHLIQSIARTRHAAVLLVSNLKGGPAPHNLKGEPAPNNNVKGEPEPHNLKGGPAPHSLMGGPEPHNLKEGSEPHNLNEEPDPHDNLKGGQAPHNLPALGAIWELVANVRVLLETETSSSITASVIRGNLGAERLEVKFTIDEKGITDC